MKTRQQEQAAQKRQQGVQSIMEKRKIVLATRGSALALRQAEIVRGLLAAEGYDTEIRKYTTAGDRDRIHALVRIGGRGIFVREIEKALLSGEADIAVHSGKDLPYELLAGLTIAGNPAAGDCRDCLITVKGRALTAEARIGTGSPRRQAEYRRLFPTAQFQDIRGNITTRLRKLESGEYDAIIMARTGMERIGTDFSKYDIQTFSPTEFVPAGCQGIIAVECRQDDREMLSLLEKVSDPETRLRFQIERELFCSMKVDCSMPVGIHAELEGDTVEISAMLQGRRAVRRGPLSEYRALCREIKELLFTDGAGTADQAAPAAATEPDTGTAVCGEEGQR